MKNYPESMLDRFDLSLMNMYFAWTADGKENFTYSHESDWLMCRRALMCKSSDLNLINNSIKTMEIAGYLNNDIHSGCFFTEKGWNRLSELIENNLGSHDAFVAIAFKDTEEIIESIKKAVESEGYNAIIMNELEHNNQIVPEIMAQIKSSKFLIMDLTHQNFGAYYEAGFAKGLGKETILTCRRKEFDDYEDKGTRPHFDVAQQSTVIWDDFEDLIEKLKFRISKTIGYALQSHV